MLFYVKYVIIVFKSGYIPSYYYKGVLLMSAINRLEFPYKKLHVIQPRAQVHEGDSVSIWMGGKICIYPAKQVEVGVLYGRYEREDKRHALNFTRWVIFGLDGCKATPINTDLVLEVPYVNGWFAKIKVGSGFKSVFIPLLEV